MNATHIAAYEPFRAQLAELEHNNSTLVFDYRTSQGNKDARSHIYKLRQTKAALEKARKDAKAEALEYGRQVDTQAKEISGRLEAMIDVHQKPLDQIEAEEAQRVQVLQQRLASLTDLLARSAVLNADAAVLAELHAAVSNTAVDESWQEFQQEAQLLKDRALAEIGARLEQRKKYEAEQAELEKLRQEAQAREKAAAEERIRKDAAERATREAEEKARREAAEKEAAAERDRLAAQKREADLKAQAERAKREKAEAEERATREKAEAEARHQRELKAAEEKAARELAEKQKREAEEAAKREANRKHVAKINAEAAAALPLSKTQADAIIKLIQAGKVPHVRIDY